MLKYILLIVGACGAVALGVFAASKIFPPATNVVPSEAGAPVDPDHAQFAADLKARAATDADLDGLSDAQEKQLGTDPNKSDTDGDGLLDRQEVNIFKTDPTKADSDGDGVKDIDEVL